MKAMEKEQILLVREGKWMGCLRKAVVLMMGMAMLCLTACGSGEPYLMTLNGMEIRPGETTVQDMADAGYDFADTMSGQIVLGDEGAETVYNTFYDLSTEAEAKTIYAGSAMVKESQRVATLSIVNRDSKTKPLSECIISGMTVYFDNEEAKTVVLEGISYSDLSVEKLKEVFGKPDIAYNTGDYYKWERGDYSISVSLEDDGSLKSISTDHNEF